MGICIFGINVNVCFDGIESAYFMKILVEF